MCVPNHIPACQGVDAAAARFEATRGRQILVVQTLEDADQARIHLLDHHKSLKKKIEIMVAENDHDRDIVGPTGHVYRF